MSPAPLRSSLNPNANGMANLIEYALGSDPTKNATGPGDNRQWSVGQSGSALSARNALAADVSLTVQAADAPDGPWINLARSNAGNPFDSLLPGVRSEDAIARSACGSPRLVPLRDPAHPQRFCGCRLRVARFESRGSRGREAAPRVPSKVRAKAGEAVKNSVPGSAPPCPPSPFHKKWEPAAQLPYQVGFDCQLPLVMLHPSFIVDRCRSPDRSVCRDRVGVLVAGSNDGPRIK